MRNFLYNCREFLQSIRIPLQSSAELLYFASAERLQKVEKPLEIRAFQRIQDFLVQLSKEIRNQKPYQFTDIVDILAYQNSHPHLNGQVLLLLFSQVGRGRISQELQRVLIVVFLVVSAAVLEGEGEEEVGEDLGVGVGEGFDFGVYLG